MPLYQAPLIGVYSFFFSQHPNNHFSSQKSKQLKPKRKMSYFSTVREKYLFKATLMKVLKRSKYETKT